MDTKKLKKLEKSIQKIISTTINPITYELINDFWLITINKIKLSPDLSYIDIFVSSLKNKEILCKKLKNYTFLLKQTLNKNIILRKMPIIRFRYDETLEKTFQLTQKINNL